MKYTACLAILALAFAFVACDEATDEPIPDGLSMTVEDDGVRGVFQQDGETLTFESYEVADQLFEVEVGLHGMILEALIDLQAGVSALDGYAAENGGETQILEEDRALLLSFYNSLNNDLPEDVPTAAITMRRVVSVWSQTSERLELTRTVMGEEGRGWTMLCGYAYCGSWEGSCSYWQWYYYSSHDCCEGGLWGLFGDCHDFWEAAVTQIPQLGNHYYSGCDDGTWTWNGYYWEACEKDHWSYPYEVGNCFGRSGSGCGGDTQYTVDATNHDGCVRNGHTVASLWCDDQFASAADDEIYAPDCY